MNRFDRILGTPKNTKVPKNRKVPKADVPTKSFDEKLSEGYYTTKLPYAGPRNGPNWKETRAAYHADQGRLDAEFKRDLFAYYGVTGHPKAERAFEIAWGHGHSAGYSEVDIYFSELAELLKP